MIHVLNYIVTRYMSRLRRLEGSLAEKSNTGVDTSSTASSWASPVGRMADFNADPRLLILIGMASIVGTAGAAASWVLVKLTALVTNLEGPAWRTVGQDVAND